MSMTESATPGGKMAMRMMANRGTNSLRSMNHSEGLAFLPFQNRSSGSDLCMKQYRQRYSQGSMIGSFNECTLS